MPSGIGTFTLSHSLDNVVALRTLKITGVDVVVTAPAVLILMLNVVTCGVAVLWPRDAKMGAESSRCRSAPTPAPSALSMHVAARQYLF